MPPASARALVTTSLRLARSNASMRACNAEKTIVNPTTSAISSSCPSCASFAASSSSLAMLKDTDTLRSDPMDESVPNVVPPMPPPLACVPPSAVGAPLIVDLDEAQSLSKAEVQDAGGESVRLLGRFFDYQTSDALQARRLVLALPPCSTTGKRRRSSHSCTARGDVIAVTGVTFGVTLGGLCAFLEGRGVPAERAHVLRTIRAQLVPVAAALRSMRGADVPHLSRGLASCRVVPAQRPYITETMVRIDSKYGNAHTCIGATATLLCCFGTMSTVPNHARHFVADSSLIKALRCSHEALEFWKVSSTHMADAHWAALAAEKRAIARAVAGAREAAREAEALRLDPTAAIMLQLHWAREAAFPANQLVSEFTQERLLGIIQRRALFTPRRPGPSWPLGPPANLLALTTALVDIVPLSQISEGDLAKGKRKKRKSEDEESVGSSSWATASSVASSFSHVSADSLGELVHPLGKTHV